MSTSLSAECGEGLVRVPLGRLHAHPANANVMPDGLLQKLARNIEREGRYPPLVARTQPDRVGEWQLLDGHHRAEALRSLGHADALVFPWQCDDETALLLLATLNRLEGEDVPARRAELLSELSALTPADVLATLLPEDSSQIEQTLSLLDLNSEALLADLTRAAAGSEQKAPRHISFAVPAEDEAIVEAAVRAASEGLDGPNRRGQALVLLCRGYLDHGGA